MRATAAAFLAVALLAPAAMAKSKEFHKVVQMAPNGRVSVSSHNGSVNVQPWARGDVGIDARIEPGDWSDHAEDVDKVKIAVSASGSDVRIKSDYDDVPSHVSWFGVNRSLPLVHYTIHVPATARLEVDVHNASIKVSGLRNDVDLETHNGEIDVADLDGAAKLETHNGAIRAAFANYSRPSRMQTHNGSIDVIVPAAARLSLDISAHRSNALDSDLPMTVRSSGSRTTSAVNGGGPELELVTHNGSLHLGKR